MDFEKMILKRLSVFIILILSLSGFLATSQPQNPDSIKAVIDKTSENKRPEVILNLVNDISFFDLKLAENYTRQALNFYIKNNDLKGMAKAYSAYGDIYANNNDFDKSGKYYQDAYELELRLKNAGEAAYNLNSIGFLYFNKNKIDIAIEYFNRALATAKSKSAKDEANALNSLGTAFRRKGENEKAKEYYTQALSVIKETQEDKTLAKTYQNLGLVNFESGEYETAIKMYLQAEKIRDKIGDLKGQGIALNNIGNVYYSWGIYETAIIYYQKAIKIFENINFLNGIASCHANIGMIYIKMKNLLSAKEYLEKALQENIMLGKKKEIADAYIKLVNLQSKLNNEKFLKRYGSNWEREIVKQKSSSEILDIYKQCLEYNENAKKISEEINDQQQIGVCLNNYGTIYSIAGEYKKALEYYQGSLSINKKIGNIADECTNLLAIGIVFESMGNSAKAISFFEEALAIAQKINKTDTEMEIYRNLSVSFENQGKLGKALQTYKIFSDLKDTILNKDIVQQMMELQTKYETDKKEGEIKLQKAEIAQKDSEAKRKNIFMIAIGLIAIIVIGFSVVIFKQYAEKKKANILLAEKNNLILYQKKEITDSIHYASRIQNAILPISETLTAFIPSHFIFYRPRDIVSGDFYYISERDGKIIIITADCTGHGVPGAFMSMLGSAFLNEIVNKAHELKANTILNDLRAQLIRTLHQTGKTGENRDGMDLTLYILDRQSKVLDYAGANNPLIIVRNNELIEYKADKMPIGIHDRANIPFTSNIIELQKDDMLYTYSDGYIDQFGGPEGKKFMSKRFKNLLAEIGHLDTQEQYNLIESNLKNWMNGYSQVDDILVIGVRV